MTLAVAAMCASTGSLAETPAVEETRLLAEWNGATLDVDPFDTFEVYLKLRVEHGDDDFWIDDGPHRVSSSETTPLRVPWPDLSSKGELIAAPAVVTGWIRVFTVDGEDRGLVGVEPRLWFAESPEETLPMDALTSLVVVEEGEALAGISPEAFVAVEVVR